MLCESHLIFNSSYLILCRLHMRREREAREERETEREEREEKNEKNEKNEKWLFQACFNVLRKVCALSMKERFAGRRKKLEWGFNSFFRKLKLVSSANRKVGLVVLSDLSLNRTSYRMRALYTPVCMHCQIHKKRTLEAHTYQTLSEHQILA